MLHLCHNSTVDSEDQSDQRAVHFENEANYVTSLPAPVQIVSDLKQTTRAYDEEDDLSMLVLKPRLKTIDVL